MKDLAPDVFRQRLLIEGIYNKEVDDKTIKDFFKVITDSLGLKTYGDPIVHGTSREGKDENQGYDAFVPLIDSGISAYVFTKYRFLSVIIYTCKQFDEQKALDIVKDFFKIEEIESKSF